MNDPFVTVPPSDLDAEKVVIGAVFLAPELLSEIAEIVQPDDFYSLNHAAIFKAMLELNRRGEPIDLVMIARQLGKETLERIGGHGFLADLAMYVPTASHALAHARAVLDCSRRRLMLETLRRLEADLVDSPAGSAAELADHVSAEVIRATQERVVSPMKSLGQTMPTDLARIKEMRRAGHPLGITVGLPALDKAIGGFEPGTLAVIAARPSRGKTAVIVNLLKRISLRTSLPVVFFSAEMNCGEINGRLMAGHASVNLWNMRRARISDSEEERLEAAVAELSKLEFYVDDTSAISLTQMRSRIRQIQQRHGGKIGAIAIDFLQLMKADRRYENEVSRLTEIAHGLKTLAKDFHAPMIALAQLNRDLEKEGREPQLSDLRGSGGIEEAADLVLMLAEGDEPNILKFHLRKQRNGPICDFQLILNQQTLRLDNLDAPPVSNTNWSH